MTVYYVNSGDSVKARKYYDLLAAMVQPQSAYMLVIGAQARTLTDLESSVAFLEVQAKEATTNFVGVNPE